MRKEQGYLIAFGIGPWLFLRTKMWSLVLTLALKLSPWSDFDVILPDDERVIHIPSNKQECCPWLWSLIFGCP